MGDDNEVTEIVQETSGQTPPLWLPVGSIRAIIAIGMTVTVCGLIANQITIPDWFMVSFTGIIAQYFNTRMYTPTGTGSTVTSSSSPGKGTTVTTTSTSTNAKP